MIVRRELCDLSSPKELELLVDLLGLSMKKSEHTLRSGFSSGQFFDIDYSTLKNTLSSRLAEFLSEKIFAIEHHENSKIDKLAFIEQKEGPINLLPMISSVSNLTGKEAVVIRLNKHLISSSVKGEIRENENLLLLNDVGTTGETIFEAAVRIWKFKAKIVAALVIIDRLQGASENLGRKGINLYSFSTANRIENEKGKVLKELFNKTFDEDKPNSRISDFGGLLSATNVF